MSDCRLSGSTARKPLCVPETLLRPRESLSPGASSLDLSPAHLVVIRVGTQCLCPPAPLARFCLTASLAHQGRWDIPNTNHAWLPQPGDGRRTDGSHHPDHSCSLEQGEVRATPELAGPQPTAEPCDLIHFGLGDDQNPSHRPFLANQNLPLHSFWGLVSPSSPPWIPLLSPSPLPLPRLPAHLPLQVPSSPSLSPPSPPYLSLPSARVTSPPSPIS